MPLSPPPLPSVGAKHSYHASGERPGVTLQLLQALPALLSRLSMSHLLPPSLFLQAWILLPTAVLLLLAASEAAAAAPLPPRDLLPCAAARGHAALVKELLSEGVPADTPDSSGTTPLQHAAAAGHAAVAASLLDHGAVPDRLDASSGTALHHAFAHNKYHVARLLLLQRGASYSLPVPGTNHTLLGRQLPPATQPQCTHCSAAVPPSRHCPAPGLRSATPLPMASLPQPNSCWTAVHQWISPPSQTRLHWLWQQPTATQMSLACCSVVELLWMCKPLLAVLH